MDLDSEQRRRVFASIGLPRPPRSGRDARLLILVGLLGLAVLLGLAARGAEGAAGTVQKGVGGGAHIAHIPLREIPNFFGPATPVPLQFFHKISSPLRPPREALIKARLSLAAILLLTLGFLDADRRRHP